MPRWPTVPQEHWERASKMRRDATNAERVLWRARRGDQLGVTFRRQHPIGPYIADFVCIESNLIVELDGGGHCEPNQVVYDRTRDEYLKSRGLRVCRISDRDVLTNLDGAIKKILELLSEKE
jgi:very-short-patch-repair endonuclease